MRNLARIDARSGEVRGLAASLPGVYELDAWLRDVWTIVPDPPDAEFIRSPAFVLRCGLFEGDCDDAATLAGSVLAALNIGALFVATRQATENDFSHVFVNVPALNFDIDPIVPAELLPIRFAEAMILPI